jgi:hypothetical protein
VREASCERLDDAGAACTEVVEYVLRGAHVVVHGGRIYLLSGGSSSRMAGRRSSRGLARCLAAEACGQVLRSSR